MNRIAFLKSLAAAAIALGTLAAATTAQARDDVQFSVKVGTPGFHAQVAPAHAHHRPVYVQPAPGFMHPQPAHAWQAPIYVQPRPVYTQPAPVYRWGHQRYNHHGRNVNAYGTRGDYDRDGIPNRYDRFPGNPNRR